MYQRIENVSAVAMAGSPVRSSAGCAPPSLSTAAGVAGSPQKGSTSSTYEYLPSEAEISIRVAGRRAVSPEAQTNLPSVFQFIAPKPRSIVLYKVSVTQITPSRRDWVVERRYSDFSSLNEKLRKYNHDPKHPFPEKEFMSWAKPDAKDDLSNLFLQKREKALSQWISCLPEILKHCNRKTRESIRKFLLPAALAIAVSKNYSDERASNIADGDGREEIIVGSRKKSSSIFEKLKGSKKNVKYTRRPPKRSLESRILSLVVCGNYITEGTVRCKEPFLLKIKNTNDLCVIIFSDGCYVRFRCRLLLRRLQKRAITSFPISHKGESVGECYIKEAPADTEMAIMSILTFTPSTILTVAVGIASYMDFYNPLKNKWELLMILFLVIYMKYIFTDSSLRLCVSDTPFQYDDDLDAEEQDPSVEDEDEQDRIPVVTLTDEKKQEIVQMSEQLHEKFLVFLREPESSWVETRKSPSGVRVEKYVGKEWDSPTILVRCTYFIPQVTLEDVQNVLNAKTLPERLIFDKNCAGMKTVADIDDRTFVQFNWQHSYFGGIISSREFLTVVSFRFTEVKLKYFPRTTDKDEVSDSNKEDPEKFVDVVAGASRYVHLDEFPERSSRPRAKLMFGASGLIPINGGVRVSQFGSVVVGGWVPNSVTTNGLYDATVEVAEHIKKHFKAGDHKTTG